MGVGARRLARFALGVAVVLAAGLAVHTVTFHANPHRAVAGYRIALYGLACALIIGRCLAPWPRERFRTAVWSALLAFAAGLILLSVYEKWAAGHATHAIAGFLPSSDASAYYRGARSILEMGAVDAWASRRPLVSMFYAVMLGATRQNLQAALYLTALLAAVALFAAASVVRSLFGFAAAIVFVAGMAHFVAPFTASMMSEMPGFVFGCLGCALLLRGAATRDTRLTAPGCFLTGLALSIRAGAYFALPAVVAIWLAIHRRAAKRALLARGAMVAAACAGALLFGALMLLCIETPEGATPNGNFAHTLYGLASGGKGWTYVKTVHPELWEEGVGEAERNDAIYAHAINRLRDNPFDFVKALARTWHYIARHPLRFVFEYCMPHAHAAWLVPMLLGTGVLVVRGAAPLRRALWVALAVLAGELLSAPFLTDAYPRSITATVWANCLLIAAAPAIWERRSQQRVSSGPRAPSPTVLISAWAPAGVFLLAALAALFAPFRSTRPAAAENEIVIRYAPGSALIVGAPGERAFAPLTSGAIDDNPEKAKRRWWTLLPAGSAVMNAFDMARTERKSEWLIFSPGSLPARRHIRTIAVRPIRVGHARLLLATDAGIAGNE